MPPIRPVSTATPQHLPPLSMHHHHIETINKGEQHEEHETQTWIPKFAVAMLTAELAASLAFVLNPTRKATVLLGVYAVVGASQRGVQTAMLATLKLPPEVVSTTPDAVKTPRECVSE